MLKLRRHTFDNILKNLLWSQFRTLVDNYDAILVCEFQKLLGRRVLTCTYRIGAKPLHQIEVSYQSSVVKTSTSNLPQERKKDINFKK